MHAQFCVLCMHMCMCTPTRSCNQDRRPLWTFVEDFMKIGLNLEIWGQKYQGTWFCPPPPLGGIRNFWSQGGIGLIIIIIYGSFLPFPTLYWKSSDMWCDLLSIIGRDGHEFRQVCSPPEVTPVFWYFTFYYMILIVCCVNWSILW